MDISIKIQREKYNDVVDYLENLSTKMTKETDIGHSYTPEVDHDQFYSMEDLGMLCVITAKKDNEVIGFHISLIQNDIFFKSIKTAYVLFYYLEKEHRKNGNGLKLFEFADDEFKKENVQRAFMSRKIHIDNERLFKKLGYNHIEANYEKYYV